MDDNSQPNIQIVKKSAATALSDLKNNPPGGPGPSGVYTGKERVKPVEGISEVPVSPEIPPEIKEMGVENVKETLELPPELKKAGVESVDEQAVFEPPKEQLVANIPLTTAQMQKGLHAQVTDSLLWLVYWCMRQIKIGKIINKKS